MRVEAALVQAGYVAREAGQAFRRNGPMSLAAVTTLMVTLLVVSASAIGVANLQHLAATLEGQVEIVAYLKPGVVARQREEIGRRIRAVPGVASVVFVPKDEALIRLQRSFAGTAALRDLVETNPLPDSFDVRVGAGTAIATAAAATAAIPGVEDVTYGVEVVDRLVSLTRAVRIAGTAGALLLMTVALIISVNTIRLTVIARRLEIEIMALVGAGPWRIRLPFLLEGGLQGILGSLAAAALALVGYAFAVERVHGALPFVPLLSAAEVAGGVAIIACASGVTMGLTGSAIAVQRFLRP